MTNQDNLRALKNAHVDALMAMPNVCGVGIGRRMKDRNLTDEIVIGVAVTRKQPRAMLKAGEIIPEKIQTEFRGQTISAPTDVVEVGEFVAGEVSEQVRASGYEIRKRPIEPGYSVGALDVTAGSIGCFLVIKGGGHLLSNLHVMQGNPFAPINQPVVQPGKFDGGGTKDIVGDASLYVPFNTSGSNSMDASTCTLRDISIVNTNAAAIGPLKGYYNQLNLGWHLRKVGRTTGLTDGHILWHDFSASVTYGTRKIQFDHQIVVHHMPWGVANAGGDSGAVWVTDDNYAAALNFAVNNPQGGFSVATPLVWVMKAFGAQLWVKRARAGEAIEGVDGTDPADAPYSAELMAEILSEIKPAVETKGG